MTRSFPPFPFPFRRRAERLKIESSSESEKEEDDSIQPEVKFYEDVDIESGSITPQSRISSEIWEQMRGLHRLAGICCIYKVPLKIWNQNERVYESQVVSIGPFHHGDPKLKVMEEHKLRYLLAFLHRTQKNLNLDKLESEIKNWEDEIRDSYAEVFDLTSDQFVRMVMVDSCFLIEAIVSYSDYTYARDVYFHKSIFLYETDMMLLENQLPFFVLDELYHLAFPNDHDETSFLKKCIKYFFYRMLIHVEMGKLTTHVISHIAKRNHQILHFVDLLRLCHLPSELRPPRRLPADTVTIPKATQVHEAGVQLKKGTSMFALDIKYENAVLEIPQVVVVEASEYLLSNILVLEMCHYKEDSYVRDYIFFMDMLIDTPKDIDLLIHKEIIVSWTKESSAVANLFNNIGYNFPIVGSNYYFYGVSQDLKEYCNVRRHRWKAAFKRDYCTTPWMIASTTAAVVLLMLTFIQAICSIIQTVRTI